MSVAGTWGPDAIDVYKERNPQLFDVFVSDQR